MPKKANGMARSATMTIANQPDILSLRVCSIGQAGSGRSRAVYPLAAATGGKRLRTVFAAIEYTLPTRNPPDGMGLDRACGSATRGLGCSLARSARFAVQVGTSSRVRSPLIGRQKKDPASLRGPSYRNGGADGTRTRDLRRDRPAF